MGLLDLFKSEDKSATISNMKADETSEANCPYCNKVLKPTPSRKKKCSHCGDIIFVRTHYKTKEKLVFTELQTKKYDKEKKEYYTTKHFLDGLKMNTNIGENAVNSQVQKHTKILAEKFGRQPSFADVAWGVSNQLIIDHPQDSRYIHFQQALFLHNTGKHYFYVREKDFDDELKEYRKSGFDKVEVITAGEHSCEECRELEGKIFTVTEALNEHVLPCKKCTHKLNEDAPSGWCRCCYGVYFK